MFKSRITLFFILLISLTAAGQSSGWKEVSEPRSGKQIITVNNFRTFSINFESLKNQLSEAPNIKNTPVRNSDFTFQIPTPDGGMCTMKLVEASIMAPELQARYPEIRTFSGEGTGEYKEASIRIDYTLKGFHAQVLMPGKTFYIDPYSDQDLDNYIVYTREAFFKASSKKMEECNPEGESVLNAPTPTDNPAEQERLSGIEFPSPENLTTNGTQLRTYRLALACTGEYASSQGGTVPLAMSAMTTSMNRVNGVFEKDVSLTMVMVSNNDDLVYLNSSTDPYTNNNGSAMLGENQTNCNSVIGSSNYDIGHVFSTGGGGVAYLQSPCSSNKARGVTGSFNPVGDPFDIDYVAHEMGHQYGANHTFNNSCGNNRSSGAAFEPGSASTIMGYAGICSPNLQNNSDAYFHNHSYTEMYNFTVSGSGNSCAVKTGTGNTPPTVSVPAGGFYIPIETPFELTASGSDANGDPITYCWEQYDLGSTTSSSDASLTNPSGNAPIFRSWDPTTNPTRVFPRISSIVNNTSVIGELLPTYSRDLTFRCTVRDNASNGGGVTDGEVAFESTSNSGPFVVTSPNTAVNWIGNTNRTITWDVANTTAAPVSCSNVDIFLSTDGGYSYPYTLITNTPNDGSAIVILPNVPTSIARIKVKASNNIFFDISNQNFSIQAGSVYQYDVAFSGVDEPSGEICGTQITPQISFLNLGSATLTSVQILYNLNGASNLTYNWTGSLATGGSTTISLPVMAVSSGPKTLNVLLQNPNGQTDQDNANNSGSQSFNVIELTGEALPITNTFEGSFPGTGWSIENPDDDYTWTSYSVNNDVNCNSSNTARINFYSYSDNGETDDLISPLIDLNSSAAPELTFDYSYARYSASYNDRMMVQVLVGCSTDWITVWDKENLDLATAGSVTASYVPACGDWSSESIDLSDYTGNIIQVRFRGITGYGNNLYLDNIGVTETIVANNPPIAQNDSYTTGFNETLTVNAAQGLLANDSDPDGDPIWVISFSSATMGTLEVVTDGSFSYIPNDGASGVETSTYTLTDGTNEVSGTLTITIDENLPPVAQNDSYTTGFNETLTVNATEGLLANDSDPDGDPLEVISYTSASLGALSIVTDGSFTYTPNDGASGIETITYNVNDGYTTVTATLTITIEGNQAPIAIDDNYSTGFNETLTVSAAEGLLANDSDPDNDPIYVISFEAASLGSLQVTSDGSFTYTPYDGESGTETITYNVNDGYTTVTATLTITIEGNQAPIAIDDNYSTGFNETLTVSAAEGLLANDSDPDNDPIYVISFEAASLGSLQVTSDGSFTYTPYDGESGTETITYNVNDGYTTVTATLTITIEGNQAPIAIDDNYSTGFNETLTVSAAEGLLANDSDPDNDPIYVISFEAASLGSLQVTSDGSFTYTPYDGESGTETLSYSIADGYATSMATLTITIDENLPPVAQNDSYTTGFNETLTVNAADGLLANDSDPDGDPIWVISFSSATMGDLEMTADGSFSYIPNDGASGVETSNYTITDGTNEVSGTLTITIDENLPPVAQNDSYTTGFNQTLTVNAADGLLANDSDPDGDPIWVISFSSATMGDLEMTTDGSFSYIPNDGASGVETSNYTITDGYNEVSGTLTITIDENLPPVAINDSYTTGFNETLTVNSTDGLLANDSDPDGDPISVTIVTAETLGSLNVSSDGSFTYTPNDGVSGIENVEYTITDGYATTTATLTITIADNQAPIAVDDNYSTGFNETLTVNAADGLLANDSDPDGDPITVTIVEAESLGSLNVSSDGSFTYTPNDGATGIEIVEYTISDGFNIATATLSITIQPMLDCEGVENGTSVPGSPCDIDGVPGIYSNDCNCEPLPVTSLDGNVDWNGACGERNVQIKLYSQDFPELNYVFNTTLEENGDFSTPDFPSGTYNVLVKVEGFLAKLYPDESISSGANSLVVTEIIPGDINGDNSVSISDVSALSSSYGSAVGDPNYILLGDFNCDGAINISDISTLTNVYGQAGDVNE